MIQTPSIKMLLASAANRSLSIRLGSCGSNHTSPAPHRQKPIFADCLAHLRLPKNIFSAGQARCGAARPAVCKEGGLAHFGNTAARPALCKESGLAHLVLFLCALLFPVLSHAQTGSQGRELSWPKTFSGQPDFVFERADVIKESLTKAKAEGSEPPATTSIDDLLVPEGSRLAPLQPRRVNLRDETENDSVLINPRATVVNNASLPEILANELLDVSEFKSVLKTAAETAVRKAKVNTKIYDFSPYLARLILQAVVTSPTQYAIINERRYQSGDRLHITIPVRVSLSDIDAALMAHMPPEEVLPADKFKQYQDAKAEVLAIYKAKIEAGSIKRQQRISVRIQKIESRRVLLNVGGRQYDLAIKFAL